MRSLGKKSAKEREAARAAKESLLMARSQIADFSQEIEADGRVGLALLEEHMDALGKSCPREIVESHDAVLSSARAARVSLEDAYNGLTKLYFC